MFLSILTLLQTNLPCSTNYYRYKNNYEKYVGDDNKDGNKGDAGGVVKTIASPRLMSKLSPVACFVKNQGINVNPMSQKGLLKYALNQKKTEKKANDSDSNEESDFSKFQSKKDMEKEKEKRQKELNEMMKLGKDVIDDNVGAIRLPNRTSKGVTIDP